MKFLPKLLFAALIIGGASPIASAASVDPYHLSNYEREFLEKVTQLEENRDNIGNHNDAIESLLSDLENLENDHFRLGWEHFNKAEDDDPKMIPILTRIRDNQLETINLLRSYNEKSQNAFDRAELNAEISSFRDSASRALDRKITLLGKLEY